MMEAFLDQSSPHDPERSARQVEGVLDLLGASPRRVLDLGCGTGRVLGPLVAAGHDAVGLDHDPDVLAACRGAVPGASLVEVDFLGRWPALPPFDVVCCLGNTLMTVVDVHEAAGLLARIADVLAPDGILLLDDFPHEFWAEVAEGYWQAGVSEDGEAQLVWEPGDAVFAVRRGEAIDLESWVPKPTDTRYRLWSTGALALLATAAGFSDPQHEPTRDLLRLERATGSSARVDGPPEAK